MAKFCSNCGSEVHENAVVCVKCGCAIPQSSARPQTIYSDDIVTVISERIKTNGIIWLVIGVIQILLGILFNWWLLLVGAVNLINSVQDIKFSRSFPQNPVGLVNKVRPLVSPIIILVYNIFFGGIIGIVGSIYYFLAVRGYVLEREQSFLELENKQSLNID